MESGNAGDRKLYVRIARAIRSAIEQGTYLPGDKLPPLAELAAQFGCSRATVREALGSLRGQGLVEFRHGDGTYVRTAAIDLWMEPLDAALLLSINQVGQIVELQTAILAGVVSRVARRVHEISVVALGQALFQLECSVPNAEEAITAELAFYLALAECTDNPLLGNVMRVMQEGFRSVLRVTNEVNPMGLSVCRSLFDAIQSGNASEAREIVYRYGETISESLETARMTRE